jgi:LysM repeat protein
MLAKSARLLAPMALAAVAIGVYLIVHSSVGTHHPAVVQQTSNATRPSSRRAAHPKFYVVKAGDTLSAISVKTHVTVARIESLNPLVSPNSLQTGQRLRLRR